MGAVGLNAEEKVVLPPSWTKLEQHTILQLRSWLRCTMGTQANIGIYWRLIGGYS